MGNNYHMSRTVSAPGTYIATSEGVLLLLDLIFPVKRDNDYATPSSPHLIFNSSRLQGGTLNTKTYKTFIFTGGNHCSTAVGILVSILSSWFLLSCHWGQPRVTEGAVLWHCSLDGWCHENGLIFLLLSCIFTNKKHTNLFCMSHSFY